MVARAVLQGQNVIAEVPTIPEELSVGKGTAKQYMEELNRFVAWHDTSGSRMDLQALDTQLVEYLNSIFLKVELPWRGEKLLAITRVR